MLVLQSTLEIMLLEVVVPTVYIWCAIVYLYMYNTVRHSVLMYDIYHIKAMHPQSSHHTQPAPCHHS
jgi:hypothetical protein